MYLSNHFALDVLSIIIGGIGTGIILYPSATNAYEWFPEHNGLIVGILETTISLGSFFWAFLGEKIINNEQIVSDEETNLYWDEEIENEEIVSVAEENENPNTKLKKYKIEQIKVLINKMEKSVSDCEESKTDKNK